MKTKFRETGMYAVISDWQNSRHAVDQTVLQYFREFAGVHIVGHKNQGLSDMCLPPEGTNDYLMPFVEYQKPDFVAMPFEQTRDAVKILLDILKKA